MEIDNTDLDSLLNEIIEQAYESETRIIAHTLWLQEGKPNDRKLYHWLIAQQLVQQRHLSENSRCIGLQPTTIPHEIVSNLMSLKHI